MKTATRILLLASMIVSVIGRNWMGAVACALCLAYVLPLEGDR